MYVECGGGSGGERRSASRRRGVTMSATNKTMKGMLDGSPPSHVMSVTYFVDSAGAIPIKSPPT